MIHTSDAIVFLFAAGHFTLRLSFLMSGNICRQQANAFEFFRKYFLKAR
jgi:hypothetical protein